MTLLGFYGQFGFGSREAVHAWKLVRQWGGKRPQDGLEGILGLATGNIRRKHEEGIDGLVGFMSCGTDERCHFGSGWEYMLVFLWDTYAVFKVARF